MHIYLRDSASGLRICLALTGEQYTRRRVQRGNPLRTCGMQPGTKYMTLVVVLQLQESPAMLFLGGTRIVSRRLGAIFLLMLTIRPRTNTRQHACHHERNRTGEFGFPRTPAFKSGRLILSRWQARPMKHPTRPLGLIGSLALLSSKLFFETNL